MPRLSPPVSIPGSQRPRASKSSRGRWTGSPAGSVSGTDSGSTYSDGDSEIIEQEAYCEFKDGRITAMDLLCSGHLPGPQEWREDVSRFDAGDLGCGSGLPEEFRRRMEAIAVGSRLETVTGDLSAREDLPSLARLLGHEVLSVRTLPDGFTTILVRRSR